MTYNLLISHVPQFEKHSPRLVVMIGISLTHIYFQIMGFTVHLSDHLPGVNQLDLKQIIYNLKKSPISFKCLHQITSITSGLGTLPPNRPLP